MAMERNTALKRQSEEITALDPDKEVELVESLGLDWADKDAEASFLEETKKTLLAQLVQEVQMGAKAAGGRALSATQAESMALADPRYEAHLQKMVEARKEANRAKVLYEAGRVKIELMRSLIAARREEMRFGGFRT